MVDTRDEGDVDTGPVALAFGDDVHGWSTAQEALDAFFEGQVVAALCDPRGTHVRYRRPVSTPSVRTGRAALRRLDARARARWPTKEIAARTVRLL